MHYARQDALRVVAMWVVPLIFLLFNPWARHGVTVLAIVVVGTFVIGGTTLSLPAISIQSLPPEHPSIWTPFRCCIFIVAYLVLWSLTYVALN
jgi:hypothetical protein